MYLYFLLEVQQLLQCCVDLRINQSLFMPRYADPFNIQLRYDVYANLQAPANYLALAKNGAGMTSLWGDLDSLQSLINMLNW